MHFQQAVVGGHEPATSDAMSGLGLEAERCLRKASEFAVKTQGTDGAWRMPSQPRVLENAVVTCSLTHVQGERAALARERAADWLRDATVQRHDPFVESADRWLLQAATGQGTAPAYSGLTATAGAHARRALYLHALACALGAPGADALQLLAATEVALGDERGSRLKPWQRIMLLAFDVIARTTLRLPLPTGTPGEFRRAQSADGSFYGMPLVTGVLHLALTRAFPDDPATHRCRESLLADQHSDGTWRFLVSEVWDTGLMVRALRGYPAFDTQALPAALAFLASTQNQDGGWACTAPLDSDNDTTGNTLLALAGTAWSDQGRTAATRYARRCQTRAGLWTTWHSSDDTPVPDVVAHMAAGIQAAALPGIDLTAAHSWLTEQRTHGLWLSDWYIPPAYGAAEISTLFPPGLHTRATTDTLLTTQRPDGGWPRITGELRSSPTATGLAVTALTHQPDPPRDSVERALRFLIATQTDEGTWTDQPVMYGPRPFLTTTGTQVHAFAARGVHRALTPALQTVGAHR